MNKWSKVLFLVAALSLMLLGAVYFILGVWIPILYFFVFTFVASISAALVLDYRLYIEFLTLKTTKHGMNMGGMILSTLVLLVAINYFAVRFNKTFDLTEERLHTLSDQSVKLISGMKEPIEIKVFYKGPAAMTEKQQVQKVLDLYKEFSSNVVVRFFNTYVDQADAQEYLNSLTDKDAAKVFAFVEVGKKRIRVDAPFDENQFTGAMVRATRRSDKKIYFLKGHGEKDIASSEPGGLKSFSEGLEGQGFKVDSLNLLDKQEIPKDAEFIAIVGPQTAYPESEVSRIKQFAQSGGRLLIAVDPGMRHNFASLLHTFGVEFVNNYVISMNAEGFTPMAIGTSFSPQSKITQSFGSQKVYVAFDSASQLKVAADKPIDLKVDELVKSTESSLPIPDLKYEISRKDLSNAKAYPLAMQVTGKLAGDGSVAPDAKPGDFEAIIFGDSDFMSNQSLFLGVNRDLALNSAADLAHDSETIGQRPKSFKGTVLEIGRYQQAGVILGGIGLPIVLLILSFVTWVRRRSA